MTSLPLSQIDTLISKICHDLISPIGATHNGLEVMEDMGGSDPAVLDMVNHSVNQASAKLMAFRLVYGEAGNDEGLKPETVFEVIDNIIKADGKITQDWNPKDQSWFEEERGQGLGKVLISLLMLGIECLPKGGSLTAAREGNSIKMTANGEDARIREESAQVLAGNAAITPHSVHAYITKINAARFGFELSLEASKDTVTFACFQI